MLGRDSQNLPIFARATKPAAAYGSGQIRGYLNLTGDGSGQTIAIVDAYDDPNIESDVNTFSSQMGLVPTCSGGNTPPSCFNFTKVYAQGSKPNTDSGWALEIALDVQWAHAVAPQASIMLVEAANSNYSNLFAAIDYATSHGASVISNSWGSTEFGGETSFDVHCQVVLCTFSSGDHGNPGGYPAYNPSVIAVGGTTLTLSGSTIVSETAWSGSGGGVSNYEPRPSYQDPFNTHTNRGMPDVSYDADPNTGFLVYDSVPYGVRGDTGWFGVGGTSAGAPQWAAIIADADQLRAANSQSPLSPANFMASSAIYSLAGSPVLYDVTSGTNGSCGSVCTAGSGYDFVTGLGSPRSGIDAALVSPLTSIAVTPTSAQVDVGQNVQFTAIGTYADGETGDISASVTWTSSDTGVATIDSTGLAQPSRAGRLRSLRVRPV